MTPVSRAVRRYQTIGSNEFPEFSQPAPVPEKRVVKLALPGPVQAPVVSTPAPSVTLTPAQPTLDRTTPPAVVVASCPAVWPWWWLAVAATVGAAAGVWGASDEGKKAAKKNGGRLVRHLVNAGVRRAARSALY